MRFPIIYLEHVVTWNYKQYTMHILVRKGFQKAHGRHAHTRFTLYNIDCSSDLFFAITKCISQCYWELIWT